MYFVKTFVILAAAAAMVSATPSPNRRAVVPVADDNCNGAIGDCFSNGCAPSFPSASATIGTCTAGTYNGCPCEKCGGTTGTYVGSCSDNGCAGFQGTCTAGGYQGCPCN